MSKNDKLNDLFEEWENDKEKYSSEEQKTRDGIIDEEKYDGQVRKVLIIAKEPNNERDNDYRDTMKPGDNDIDVKHGFCKRMAEWTCGLLKDFPPLEEIDGNERVYAMRRMAFMNIKKTSGKGQVDMVDIKTAAEKHVKYIQREIKIIAPTIIVAAFGRNEDILKVVFPDMEIKSSGYDVSIGTWGNMAIISFYHPSYRIPKSMSYALLKTVATSEPFTKLLPTTLNSQV
jgi:hypothetical protein